MLPKPVSSALRGAIVHQITLHGGLDTLLFGIPAIALLVFGYFRLDEIFVSKAGRPRRVRIMPAEVKDEASMACDPDGRPWAKPLTPK